MIYIILIIITVIIFIYLFSIKFIRRKILRNLAINIIKILNKENINYWVDFGTLLGIFRDKDIILGDNDVDIVLVDNNNLYEQMKIVGEKLKEKNINLEKMNWSAYRAYRYNYFADLYINKISKNIYKGSTGDNSDIPIEIIGKPKFIKWMNIDVRVPGNIEETLKWRYGDDYMTPKSEFKGRDS